MSNVVEIAASERRRFNPRVRIWIAWKINDGPDSVLIQGGKRETKIAPIWTSHT